MSELCADIRALDLRLAGITAQREGGRERGGGRRVSHSPPPWNAAAALCRLDLHALVREIESGWRAAAGFGALARGGSEANTLGALAALERLCDARGVDWRGGARELERWARGARTVLGDLERPRRLADGGGCPFCRMRTLRIWMRDGIIRCVNPVCVTPSGGKATATFDYYDGRIQLVWRDGGGTAAG